MSNILGENCKWVLTWNGNIVDLGKGLDMDLDSFLFQHLSEASIKNRKILFSKQSPLEIANEKIDKIKSDIDSVKQPIKSNKITSILDGDDEIEYDDIERYYIPDSIGVTKAIGELSLNGTSPLVTPVDIEAWARKKIADLNADKDLKTIDGKSLQDWRKTISAEKLVEMERESWPVLTEYGTNVHAVFEDIFNGNDAINKGLPEDIFNSVVKQVKDFKQSLEKKYPGCKFYPELHIKSQWDTLSADLQAALNLKGKKSIDGVIDLLVIDAQGNGHIYDYKVSRKGIAKNNATVEEYQQAWNTTDNGDLKQHHLWVSSKKLSAGYQVELYKNILNQYDISVLSTHIVPIKLDLEYKDPSNPFAITNLNAVSVADEQHMISDPARKYKTKINNLFLKPVTQSIEDIDSLGNMYNAFFATESVGNAQRSVDEQINYYKQHSKYVKKLDKDDRNYKAGEKEFIIWFPGVRKPSFCTADNMDNVLRELVINQKNHQSAKYLEFANAVKTVLAGDSREVLLGQVGTNQRNFIETAFGRYLDNGWELASDDSTHSTGIMVFKKGNKSEIVCLASDGLRAMAHLSRGKSLLGQTKADKYVDSRKILPALQGNLALMKAMLYVAQHEDVFKQLPISGIKAVNPWYGIQHSVSNSQLCENYAALVKEHPSCGATNVDSELFMSDFESLVDQSEEMIENLNLGKQEEDFGTAEWFQKKIDWFKKQYSKELNLKNGYQDTPYHNVLANLEEGLLLARGFRGHIESDKGDWVNGKFYELDGLMIASPQYSSSANIRELGKAIDEYAKEVRKQIYVIGAPIQQAFIKFYKAHGTGAKAFNSWFEDKEKLILKDPDSHDFDGDPVGRETLKIFLETMCKLRHPEYTTQEQLDNAKYDEDYYAIPLLEAKFSRQVKGVGLFKAIKNKLKENWTTTKDLFMGDEDEVLQEGIEQYVSTNQEIYNKLKYDNMDARDARLKKYGAGMCETDLELVINAMLYSFCRSNVSREYIPIIAGLKTVLDRADALGGTDARNMSNIRKRFNDMVRTKFYGESLIPKQLQPLYKFLNIIKSGFTTLTLSLNVRSFLRESLQGIFTGVSRAGVKMYPGITEKYYIEGLTYVIQEAHKNFSGVSLLRQLNAVYGMANQSLSQIANQRRVNWAHINHWGKDTLFLTATAPDFMHRMGLLVAKMKSDGSFDAHELNSEGILVYNWKKDKRFEHFAKGETSHADYLKEKDLYETMIEDFNTAGFRKADGSKLDAKNLDDLPQAYTRTEGQSIKNYADLLYGHYDEESKSLLYDTLFGAVWMQYKTFLTSKLEQWTMHEGQYNVATLEQQYDENGNEMYVKFYEDAEGRAHKDIILKSEYEALNDDEKKTCRLYYDYSGLPMQGMLQESLKVYKSLITMDRQKLKELWSDPTTRAMFKLQLHDLWLMAFLTMLVTLIFGDAEGVDEPLNPIKVRAAVKKAGPIENFAYNIITGSMADSQLGNILSSFTDKPPMISALKRFGTSSMKMITGNASIAWWLTKNIGILSDFQGMAEVYNNAK